MAAKLKTKTTKKSKGRQAKAPSKKKVVKGGVPKGAPRKKVARKAAPKKAAPKKTIKKKVAAKKTASKRVQKTVSKKTGSAKKVAKKVSTKKAQSEKVAKKTPIKKTVKKKVASKKAGPKKAAPKKAAPKKVAPKKVASKKAAAPKAAPSKAAPKKAVVKEQQPPKIKRIIELDRPTGAYNGIILVDKVKPFPGKSPYTKGELDRLAAALQEERQRLNDELASLHGVSREAMDLAREHPGYSVHLAEHATDLQTAEANLGVRNIEQERLDLVEEALDRIKNNVNHYGLCLACGSKIGIQRLIARPHAHLCLDCRHKYERIRARRGY